MKIGYNDNSEIYYIYLEYPETEIYIKANDIVEARETFIKGMTQLFDEAVREQLKD